MAIATGIKPFAPEASGTTRAPSYSRAGEFVEPSQNAPLAPVATFKPRWIIAVGVIVVVLAFWFWHSRDGHAPAKDPAAIEQEAHDHPDDFRAQIAWAKVLMQTGRVEEAAPVLDQANRLMPTDARPYAWKGVLAAVGRDESTARELFQQALQRDPSNPDALRGLANLDAQTHHVRSAIQGFQHLVQLRPQDADGWQRLGLLLMGAGENYRSLDALTHAAALAPNDLMTERTLGNMALYAGRLDQADTAFHIVLAQKPDDPQALVGLAGVMMRKDPSPAGLAAAEKQADAAIDAAPTSLAYYIRGQIRMNEHRLPEAIQDLNTSLSLEPNHRQTYVLLSQCYASAGKPELAKKVSLQFEKLTAAKLARDHAPKGPPEANR